MFRVLLAVLCVSSLALEGLQALVTPQRAHSAGLREGRAVDDHAHDEGTHAIECALGRSQLVEAFNQVAAELNLTGLDGNICSLPVPECRHHDDDEEEEGDHHGDDKDRVESGSGEGSSSGVVGCWSVLEFCHDLVVHSGLVPADCLSGECPEENDNSSSSSDDRPSAAEAYGLGFLMVFLVSLGSLLGVLVVPLVNGKDKSKSRNLAYKYLYFFMIALGTSALICDAILHLFPHAWGLHAHSVEEGGHGVVVEEFVWKGTMALLSIYLFYLLEFLLHGLTSHTHSRGFPTDTEECKEDGKECIQLEASMPHGVCAGSSDTVGILHPATATPDSRGSHDRSEVSLVKLNGGPASEKGEAPGKKGGRRSGVVGWLSRVKPLAWLIIIGDGLHNFADGLALGAAISQSLTLGISTTIALILHEIPHEFGDYVILLSTGLTWYSALLFNLFSALTAILGFFVGVAVGTESEAANAWILAFAAGLFIYIALVDLLPELIHAKEKGRHRWGLFLAANIGFFLSFLALFLLAVYEEQLDNLL